MKKSFYIFPDIIAYFFVLLFCYAASSKVFDFENFQVQLAQSPLLSAYAGAISYAVIIVELIIVLLLCIKSTRLTGLYLSLGIMISFTVYIYLILNYSDFVPCSCGGILEKLGWTEHMIFNIVCVLMAFSAVCIVERQEKRKLSRTMVSTGGVILASAAMVIVLFLSSENIIKKENNFTRRFLLHPVIEDKVLDLGINSYYFAGVDDGKIYLGNSTAPLLLTSVDTSLTANSSMKISLDKSDHKFRNLQVQVCDSFYFLYDGSVPVIYRGVLGDSLTRTISYRDAYFTQLVVLDSSRFAIRTQSRQNRQYTLASLNLSTNPKLKLRPSILEKQIDGVFDSDGTLIGSRGKGSLIYTYSYRNQFVVMDQDLSVLRRLNTIDTTSRAKIETRQLSDGNHKMTAPPLVVNKIMTGNGQLLFIQSNLMGKHESSKAWKNAAVVDIYHTDRQEYVGSFYIQNRKENTISQMLATDKYLYVLIGNELIRYQFRTALQDPKPGEAENL
ncbi:MauE/DoxX family redox-associated membrane protein [Chryseobacterium herbae]|uniref:Tellurium resistance protein TerC n=1 Tax=Chryseobacterium herbae TaxID=2976476 RepID=A0ABT2ITJ4_9FLAO|nr:MauE/DoxX family redox-associated membrane protein [Chryseobacterium sp. pc1-10]MCT2561821.1 tellurium resistance protein TerC [Chryseobacterium sp. pc1-10]